MQISKDTFNILRNFSTINPGIVVKGGEELETISIARNIMAKADITETFEKDFAIYDLNEFLGVTNSDIFEGADYSFNETAVNITKDNAKTHYFYANPETVVSPSKDPTMPDSELTFELKDEDFEKAKFIAGILKKPDLCLQSDGNDIKLVVLDKKDDTSNVFELNVGQNTSGSSYKFYFKAENLKIIKGNYDVSISSKGISNFKHQDIPVQYWIALEQGSEYEENDNTPPWEGDE